MKFPNLGERAKRRPTRLKAGKIARIFSSKDPLLQQERVEQPPDFLVVGMQKAGTRWIYDLTRKVSCFEPLPIKEFHHFDCFRRTDLSIERKISNFNRIKKKAYKDARSIPRSRFDDFIDKFDDYKSSGFSDASYNKLFEKFPDKLVGDITPGYSTLKENEIAEIKEGYPDLRVILIIRKPTDRAWSAFNMYLRRRYNDNCGMTMDEFMRKHSSAGDLEHFLNLGGVIERSFPTVIAHKYSQFGDNLLIVGFEHIVKDQISTSSRIIQFLTGGSSSAKLKSNIKNAKSHTYKITKTKEHDDVLAQHFSEEIALSQFQFPDIARDWDKGMAS